MSTSKQELVSIEQEFATIHLVLASGSITCGVDAFCLAWVKFERQLRKLAANCLYQASAFRTDDVGGRETLRADLLKKKTSSYRSFLGAIRALSGHDIRGELRNSLAAARGEYLWHSIEVAHERRNKILHGLQTGEKLSREVLVQQVNDIMELCGHISDLAEQTLGYNGFSRDSLRKNNRPALTTAVDLAIGNSGWKHFVANRF